MYRSKVREGLVRFNEGEASHKSSLSGTHPLFGKGREVARVRCARGERWNCLVYGFQMFDE